MAKINLLPWREQKREDERKQFLQFMILTASISFLILIVFYFYADLCISGQEKKNLILEQEIAVLDKQILQIQSLQKLRSDLISRMMIIQSLESTRGRTVRLFDELINITPPGIFLTKIERTEEKITIIGYSESNSAVSQLMKNIEDSEWIMHPILTEIKKSQDNEGSGQNSFKLSFDLKKPQYMDIQENAKNQH